MSKYEAHMLLMQVLIAETQLLQLHAQNQQRGASGTTSTADDYYRCEHHVREGYATIRAVRTAAEGAA